MSLEKSVIAIAYTAREMQEKLYHQITASDLEFVFKDGKVHIPLCQKCRMCCHAQHETSLLTTMCFPSKLTSKQLIIARDLWDGSDKNHVKRMSVSFWQKCGFLGQDGCRDVWHKIPRPIDCDIFPYFVREEDHGISLCVATDCPAILYTSLLKLTMFGVQVEEFLDTLEPKIVKRMSRFNKERVGFSVGITIDTNKKSL